MTARAFVLILLTGLLAASCDTSGDALGPPRTTADGRRTVASLVPAATDLIVAMGAAEQLVAVSNFDADRDATRGLPRVGDYQNTDWEQIRALRPGIMVRQFAPDRVPPGLRERCTELGIELVNVEIDRLGDIFTALQQLGRAMGREAEAARAEQTIRSDLDSVKARVAGRPKVDVLIARDETGLAVIGPDTFLDEVLTIAGGTNAAAGLGQRYPTIDREMLRSLDPQVIVQLLPAASPQVLERARATWAAMPELRAVREGRVHLLTEWYLLLPGPRVADVARTIAEVLHPSAATRPVSRAGEEDGHRGTEAQRRHSSLDGFHPSVTWVFNPCERCWDDDKFLLASKAESHEEHEGPRRTRRNALRPSRSFMLFACTSGLALWATPAPGASCVPTSLARVENPCHGESQCERPSKCERRLCITNPKDLRRRADVSGLGCGRSPRCVSVSLWPLLRSQYNCTVMS